MFDDFEALFAFADMLEQHEAYLTQPQQVRDAQKEWTYSCRNDFAYADRFVLTPDERHAVLGWISNQRDYARLCKEGLTEVEAHYQARDNYALLKGSERPVKKKSPEYVDSIALLPDSCWLPVPTSDDF